MENVVAWEMVRETEVLEENLPQRCSIHNKSHMKWPVTEPQPPRLRAGG
jgi:hypothetical protein